MFLSYYGLREQPFGVTPDPRFLYFGATHREAFASLIYSIREKRGFSAIAAEPGMGKTSLLFHLLKSLGNTARTAFLFQTATDSKGLLHSLLADLGVSTSGMDLVAMREALNGVLLQEFNHSRTVVVVIDEAQSMDDEVLETVRMLSNFETPEQKLMHIVLSGQPTLVEKLGSFRLVQLRQRIGSVTRLEAFGREETEAYIQHRLRVAGHDGSPLFSADAYECIARASQGIPRNINSLCFQALSLGFATKARSIGPDILNEVISDCDFRLERVSRMNAPLPGARWPESSTKPTAPEVARAVQKPHAARTPAAPPRHVAAVNLRPIPKAAPARSAGWGLKAWITIPALATAAILATGTAGVSNWSSPGTQIQRLYRQAVAAMTNADRPQAGPKPTVAASKNTIPRPGDLATNAAPAPAQKAVPAAPAPDREISLPVTAKAATDPGPPGTTVQEVTIVTPKRMTAAEISRVYLGGSDWPTLYKLLVLNPEIGWGEQEIPKGTRIMIPRLTIATTIPTEPSAEANTDPVETHPRANFAPLSVALPTTGKGPTLVAVTHTESIFQFAMESYGRSSWAIVGEICKANPQLEGVYAILHKGELIRLPAPPDPRAKPRRRAKHRARP